jgi:HD superfamily phosphohydrolase YqeK
MWCLTKIASQVRMSAPLCSRDEFATHRQSYSWPISANYITEMCECKNSVLQFAVVEHTHGEKKPSSLKKVINITFVFHRILRAFLCRDDAFHCDDYC